MKRSAGLLVHPSSLPGPFGTGDFGPAARKFIRWMADAGFSWWQILPLNPPGPGFSPYSASSTFALSPWMISPEDLVEDGLLDSHDVRNYEVSAKRLDADGVRKRKSAMLESVRLRWKADAGSNEWRSLEEFKNRHASWLDDWAVFSALKEHHGPASWLSWPTEIRLRDTEALARARDRLAEGLERAVLTQYLAFRQWGRLRSEAEDIGVSFIGDLPIFVAGDSADVWAHRECFLLDDDGNPRVVAGVPPDYFSATGQLWGNPLYDWEYHEETGYRWWIGRLSHTLDLTPVVRIDHFRGFAACWEIPAGAETAVEGRWVPGPGRKLFDAFRQTLGMGHELPFIAEDLGVITPDVVRLREDLGLPGMAILQFAFSPSMDSTYLPHAHRHRMVVYTGTHDNTTVRGWFEHETSEEERRFFLEYCGCPTDEVHWSMIRLALGSVAEISIIPIQDFLGLDQGARMNIPGRADGNWGYRMTEIPDTALAQRIRHLVSVFGRT